MKSFFKHQQTNNVEVINGAFLPTLILGPIFFAARGVWIHSLLSLILSLVTFGISWLIYPFMANNILRSHYVNNGWIEISEKEALDKIVLRKGAFHIYSTEDYIWGFWIITPIIMLFYGMWPLSILWFLGYGFFMRLSGYLGEPKKLKRNTKLEALMSRGNVIKFVLLTFGTIPLMLIVDTESINEWNSGIAASDIAALVLSLCWVYFSFWFIRGLWRFLFVKAKSGEEKEKDD
jgi:hypothetical protein|tara:strand:- start:79 stop:780 length:702 start_codon:yes stop_codon:yes gene_type:complete